MAVSHQSPQSGLPPLAYKQLNTTTWGSGGNSSVITDAYVHTNSAILAWVTGTTPRAGTGWAIAVSQGTFTITSTDAESSSLPISYIVL